MFSKTQLSKFSRKPTQKKGVIRAMDETSILEMPYNEEGGLDYTLEEIGDMTIPCAWCGKPIFIGWAVTLNGPIDKKYKPPEGSVVYSTDPLRLVGCLRDTCGEGIDRSGFWIPDPKTPFKGYVRRVLSPMEQLLMSGDDVVICNDLTDPKKAIPVVETAQQKISEC